MFSGLLLLLAAGPVSKWEERAPGLDYVSGQNIFAAERCLIDLRGTPAPIVYRQPDRPTQVMLVYQVNNRAVGRVDLSQAPTGVRVKVWNVSDEAVLHCAPRG